MQNREAIAEALWGAVLIVTTCIVVWLFLSWATATQAQAGWFDFIGDTAGAISEATWKVALIKAVERSAPMILLGITLIGAIVSMWGAGALAMRLHASAKQAMHDSTITSGEWILLGLLALITLPVVSGLLWFGWFLATASQSGLAELMG